MIDCKDEKPSDFSQDTWLSLMGLLRPSEYFVTIDHFPIWRRHLAWAKTDGDDLQKHTTQQFATNMVFMSLLLGAELNVLFNSSKLTTEMREHMQNEDYHELKYWIGVVILVSVFVTITALVGTFTAWRMVSAVSETNAHCILRSSIGQYVTHLPSRLIVAALYSFLLWMMMFLVDMLSGPLCIALFAIIGILFAQLIISYSAFGRLIIHTGAMGKKQILDPELERSLLPSGLHASLLIKATGQLHRRTSVTTQYKSPEMRKSTADKKKRNSLGTVTSRKDRLGTTHIFHESGVLTADDEELIMRTAETLSLRSQPDSVSSNLTPAITPSPNEKETETSMDFSDSCGTSEDTDDVSLSIGDLAGEGFDEKASETSDVTNDSSNGVTQFVSHWKSPFERRRAASGTFDSSTRRALRRRASVKLMEEWQDESDCRQLYDIPPPPELPDDSDDESCESDIFMPRASILNRTKNMKSLRILAKESVIRSSSMSDNDNIPAAEEETRLSSFFSPMTNLVRMVSDRASPSPSFSKDIETAGSSYSSDSKKPDLLSDDVVRVKRVNFAPAVLETIDNETLEIDCESQRLLSDQQPHYSSNGGVQYS